MTLLIIIIASLFSDVIVGMNPVLENLSEAFPDIGYGMITLVSTIPGISYIVTASIISKYIGRKVKYRTSITGGCACVLVGGMLPGIFPEHFAAILAARLVLGIGLGLLSTMKAYISELYEGRKRQRVLGWNTAAMNAGSVSVLLAAGFLGSTYWHHSAFGYAAAVVPLVFALFIKEPEHRTERFGKTGSFTKLRPKVFVFAGMMVVVAATMNGLNLVISSMMVDRGLGGSGTSGIILSVYIAGGIIAGASFEIAKTVLKKAFISAVCLLGALGAAVVLYSDTTATVTVGCFICGYAFFAILTGLIEMASVEDKENTAVAITAVSIGDYLGYFLSTPCLAMTTAITGGRYTGAFGTMMAVLPALAIISFIILNNKKPE